MDSLSLISLFAEQYIDFLLNEVLDSVEVNAFVKLK